MVEFDVLVIGGGPTGLWLACELKLAGVSVCVLERRAEATAQSRSLTIHGRTLEMFALRGLAERFLARGRPIPNWHFGGLSTRLDFSCFEARYPFMLFIEQTQTEAILEERARELGVEIRRNCNVDRIVDVSDKVTIEGSTPDTGFELTARYLVGADGARSTVRQEANIEFDGVPATQSIMMADAVINYPDKTPTLSVGGPYGAVMALPLANGIQSRIICFDPQRRHVHPHEPLDREELAQSMMRILGTDLDLRDITWLTRFSDETRLAERYRKERIFLVGDAAHIHAPMGGQGLNVGLQDAMNLGWKLASVIHGRSPEVLLDTYQAERRPIGQRLFDNTLAQALLATGLDSASQALRSVVARFLENIEVNRDMAGEISGFSLRYPHQLLNNARSDDALIGARVPDSDIRLPDGSLSSIYAGLFGGRWLQLTIAPDVSTELPAWLVDDELSRMSGEPTVQWESLKGVRALLIRPDGYVEAVKR